MSAAAHPRRQRKVVGRLLTLWHQASPPVRRRLVALYGALLASNIGVWVLLFAAARTYPALLGLATIAYGFGLRHAVDPDHIAAIDNTTRTLMQDGKRPVAVGLFFSLGHATVVFLLSCLVALSASFVKHTLPQMEMVGSVIGTTVSGLFLIVIAIINLVVLVDLARTWWQVEQGAAYDDRLLDDYLTNRGLLARILKPLLRLVSQSWHLYPIGFLFGLGFDTASEVGILGMSATAGSSTMPVLLILLLPLLFAAGMALADTTVGILMLGAYGWAYVRPVRKLYYNMTITLISVIIALGIGGLECLQVIIQETGARGGIWDTISSVSIGDLGFAIIGVFALSWFISVAYYRLRGIDRLDA